MCPEGFPIPMSPAFGVACGGEVARSDPVVTEVEPGSACAGIRYEPSETVEEINVDEAPGRRDEAVKTPRKRHAENEVFIGTPERCPTSRVRQMNNPAETSVRFSLPVGSPLMNAPRLSTQGGTTLGVTRGACGYGCCSGSCGACGCGCCSGRRGSSSASTNSCSSSLLPFHHLLLHHLLLLLHPPPSYPPPTHEATNLSTAQLLLLLLLLLLPRPDKPVLRLVLPKRWIRAVRSGGSETRERQRP